MPQKISSTTSMIKLHYFEQHLEYYKQLIPGYCSETSIVAMKVNLSSFKRGNRIWKLNCSLLHDTKYIEMVNTIIELIKQEYSVPVYSLQSLATLSENEIHLTVSDSFSLFQFLETLLHKIRGDSIK